MGLQAPEEYDASADATLERGTYFTYWDDTSEENRVGCFVALNDNDEIVTHFVATERYVRRLPYSNYDG